MKFMGTIDIIVFHLPNLSTPVMHIELEASTMEKSRVYVYAHLKPLDAIYILTLLVP